MENFGTLLGTNGEHESSDVICELHWFALNKVHRICDIVWATLITRSRWYFVWTVLIFASTFWFLVQYILHCRLSMSYVCIHFGVTCDKYPIRLSKFVTKSCCVFFSQTTCERMFEKLIYQILRYYVTCYLNIKLCETHVLCEWFDAITSYEMVKSSNVLNFCV